MTPRLLYSVRVFDSGSHRRVTPRLATCTSIAPSVAVSTGSISVGTVISHPCSPPIACGPTEPPPCGCFCPDLNHLQKVLQKQSVVTADGSPPTSVWELDLTTGYFLPVDVADAVGVMASSSVWWVSPKLSLHFRDEQPATTTTAAVPPLCHCLSRLPPREDRPYSLFEILQDLLYLCDHPTDRTG